MTTFIGVIGITIILFITISHYLVMKLLNGKLVGTYNGFIGKYILRTFRKDGLYYRGIGVPVTITREEFSPQKEGTVIFLGTPCLYERDRCTINVLSIEDKVGYWWTRDVNRNPKANDFGRFDNKLDEILTVPIWITSLWRQVLFIGIALLILFPSFAKASNYNQELIKLHRNLSHFQYDFRAMPGGKYRAQHARKHFFGKNKPLPVYTSETPYGRRNSAAIVDILTNPQHWEVCEATDEFPKGTLNHKLGLWNEQWALFMVFGYVSAPIRGQVGGVLVSAYVEKQGKRKLRCNWDNKNYEEFNRLRYILEQKTSNKLTLKDYGNPITLGAIVAGVLVTGEELLSFLGFLALGTI